MSSSHFKEKKTVYVLTRISAAFGRKKLISGASKEALRPGYNQNQGV